MKIILLSVLLSIMIASSLAFRSFLNKPVVAKAKVTKTFATIVDGVDFDTIAREWRLKWSADNDKKSLASAQQSKINLIFFKLASMI